MRSKLFTDERDVACVLDRCVCADGSGLPQRVAADRLCVCLRMPAEAYGVILAEAGKRGQTSGDFIAQLIEAYCDKGKESQGIKH